MSALKIVDLSLTEVMLTLLRPVVSNGDTSKCLGPYWSNPPFLVFLTRRSRLNARVPECQKIKRVGKTSMALNPLVDSFLPQSEKVWDWKGQRCCEVVRCSREQSTSIDREQDHISHCTINCYHPQMWCCNISVIFVCLCVCLVRAQTYWMPWPTNLILVHRYAFRISTQGYCQGHAVKGQGHKSTEDQSSERVHTFMGVCARLNGNVVSCVINGRCAP